MANLALPIRNIFMPPKKMFAEVEIHQSAQILDFGCGPGYFTLMAAEQAGSTGKVYALDIHRVAVEIVETKAQKKGLKNIVTILSKCETSIPENSIDVVIFFDVFHVLDNRADVLQELHRVLRPDGKMYFSDHHMNEEEIVAAVCKSGLFRLKSKSNLTYIFGEV